MFVAAIAYSLAATAATAAAPPLTPINAAPIVAETCAPTTNEARRGLIFIGGSEGGLTFPRSAALRACEAGYAAMALAYWRHEALPGALERIELGYFDTAVDAFLEHTGFAPGQIGFAGWSRGSEAAMLVAARNPSIGAVAGITPGVVVGANINFADFWNNQPAWTRDGADLAYLTLRPNRPGADWREMRSEMPAATPRSARAQFDRMRVQPGYEDALLPVDAIDQPVLLLGAGEDAVWDSCGHGAALAARRPGLETHFICFETAEHDFMASTADETGGQGQAGWSALFAFFNDAL